MSKPVFKTDKIKIKSEIRGIKMSQFVICKYFVNFLINLCKIKCNFLKCEFEAFY